MPADTAAIVPEDNFSPLPLWEGLLPAFPPIAMLPVQQFDGHHCWISSNGTSGRSDQGFLQ
jgi:hypothetical protein